MHVLRWVLLLACLGCCAFVITNGRWEGHLIQANYGTWIVALDRAPIWAPPPEAVYATFQKDFKDSEKFPAEDASGFIIKRVLKDDWMILDFLLYLWPVTVISGLLYYATRGRKRDFVLHLGLFAGIGLTAGAVLCVGLWLLFGGWGPPAPQFFGILGLSGGIVGGLVSFKQGIPNQMVSKDTRHNPN